MPLFSTLQIANNALIAAQLGLQVTGNNIANAGVPSYVRQNLVLAPSPTQKYGGLLLGMGVSVEAVKQQIDLFLDERLRNSNSDVASSEAQSGVYTQLESIIGELGDTDLSTSLTKFFGSLNDILNQPDSVSVRNLAVLQGATLTDDIRRLDARVRDVRDNVNQEITSHVDTINSLLKDIAKLNNQIVTVEGGGTSASDAVGLRDQRADKLGQLAQIMNIKVVEQETGDVTVFSGGDFLVFEGTAREVTTSYKSDRDLQVTEIRLAETDSPLAIVSGKLAGLTEARDQVLGGFLDRLDHLTKTLAFEFNKVYSSGQGLKGLTSATSEASVDSSTAALDHAGLTFTPVNGSFQIQVVNQQTGLTQTHEIRVDLNGLDSETSLASLATAVDAIDGVAATVTADRRLQISSESPLVAFSFANDTSGALAALGINTFFTGNGASDLGVTASLRADPSRFAASTGGIGEDTGNAEKLAALLNTPLASEGNTTLAVLYDRMVGETTQGAALTKSIADGFKTFQTTLDGQRLAISGVNIDEEAIKMIGYQRMFQASARFIKTINELLDVLVAL
jgi:flagellar hook-associated protein 1 FlgK